MTLQENPEEPQMVETVDDLPFDAPTGTVMSVALEDQRLYIFDGFKWKAEGDRPGAWIEHYPPPPPPRRKWWRTVLSWVTGND